MYFFSIISFIFLGCIQSKFKLKYKLITNGLSIMNYNSDPQESAIYDDDEIDLKELFSVLWRHKLLIILLTSFFALVSV